ncbi:hypothetical protein SESBI_46183 [Sesbania bispinosa]|nr:hypothetical protein SESBI_46183 [Sesbania bispinosa]
MSGIKEIVRSFSNRASGLGSVTVREKQKREIRRRNHTCDYEQWLDGAAGRGTAGPPRRRCRTRSCWMRRCLLNGATCWRRRTTGGDADSWTTGDEQRLDQRDGWTAEWRTQVQQQLMKVSGKERVK